MPYSRHFSTTLKKGIQESWEDWALMTASLMVAFGGFLLSNPEGFSQLWSSGIWGIIPFMKKHVWAIASIIVPLVLMTGQFFIDIRKISGSLKGEVMKNLTPRVRMGIRIGTTVVTIAYFFFFSDILKGPYSDPSQEHNKVTACLGASIAILLVVWIPVLLRFLRIDKDAGRKFSTR